MENQQNTKKNGQANQIKPTLKTKSRLLRRRADNNASLNKPRQNLKIASTTRLRPISGVSTSPFGDKTTRQSVSSPLAKVVGPGSVNLYARQEKYKKKTLHNDATTKSNMVMANRVSSIATSSSQDITRPTPIVNVAQDQTPVSLKRSNEEDVLPTKTQVEKTPHQQSVEGNVAELADAQNIETETDPEENSWVQVAETKHVGFADMLRRVQEVSDTKDTPEKEQTASLPEAGVAKKQSLFEKMANKVDAMNPVKDPSKQTTPPPGRRQPKQTPRKQISKPVSNRFREGRVVSRVQEITPSGKHFSQEAAQSLLQSHKTKETATSDESDGERPPLVDGVNTSSELSSESISDSATSSPQETDTTTQISQTEITQNIQPEKTTENAPSQSNNIEEMIARAEQPKPTTTTKITTPTPKAGEKSVQREEKVEPAKGKRAETKQSEKQEALQVSQAESAKRLARKETESQVEARSQVVSREEGALSPEQEEMIARAEQPKPTKTATPTPQAEEKSVQREEKVEPAKGKRAETKQSEKQEALQVSQAESAKRLAKKETESQVEAQEVFEVSKVDSERVENKRRELTPEQEAMIAKAERASVSKPAGDKVSDLLTQKTQPVPQMKPPTTKKPSERDLFELGHEILAKTSNAKPKSKQLQRVTESNKIQPVVSVEQAREYLESRSWRFKRDDGSSFTGSNRSNDIIQTVAKLESTSSGGNRIPTEASQSIQPFFGNAGNALNDSRVHSTISLKPLGLKAATKGSDIHMEPGQDKFNTPSQLGLLGHEVAHQFIQRSSNIDQEESQADSVEQSIASLFESPSTSGGDEGGMGDSSAPIMRSALSQGGFDNNMPFLSAESYTAPSKSTVQRAEADSVVQREDTGAPAADASATEGSDDDADGEGQAGDSGKTVSIPKLAEKVYPYIKRLLAREREQRR